MAAVDPPKKPVRDPYEMSQYVRFGDTTEFQIDSFFRRMYRWGIFNGTYLFHKNDSLCFGAMGYATFSQLDSLKPADLFQLASVSKTFTGMAMMLLVQDGYLQEKMMDVIVLDASQKVTARFLERISKRIMHQ